VKLGQFMLSANDTAFRTYTLRIAVNNATVSTPVFSDGSFTLGAVPAPGAIALLGLAGLTGRRRR
jgi:MYXO-CTERM domain-containing protein